MRGDSLSNRTSRQRCRSFKSRGGLSTTTTATTEVPHDRRGHLCDEAIKLADRCSHAQIHSSGCVAGFLVKRPSTAEPSTDVAESLATTTGHTCLAHATTAPVISMEKRHGKNYSTTQFRTAIVRLKPLSLWRSSTGRLAADYIQKKQATRWLRAPASSHLFLYFSGDPG